MWHNGALAFAPKPRRYRRLNVTSREECGPTGESTAQEPTSEPLLVIRPERHDVVRSSINPADRFELLSDITPIMAWCHGADGGLEYVNRAWEAFFGISAAEARASAWQPLLHPDDRQRYVSAFQQSVDARAPFHAEARVRRHDGEWRWIESWGAPCLSASGELLAYVGSSPDITERKRLEEMLRVADERKNAYLGVLAHELRNPIAPMQTALQVLDRSDVPPVRAQQMRDVLRRQLRHLTNLIGDLLDVASISAGKVLLSPAAVDLASIARSAVADFEASFAERGITLSLTVCERAPIYADEKRVCQIVHNLLHNACKFTPHGGTVTVAVSCNSSCAILSVKDSGIGMDAETLAKVFEPFVQVTRSEQRGLGLGLALVKGYTDLHGGTVTVESEGYDKGSTFMVRLPTRN